VRDGPLRRSALLYDAECRLCRFTARTVTRLDRRKELAIIPLQDDDAAQLLAAVPVNERLASWRVVSTDGGTLAGFGAGAVPLMRAMGFTRAARLLDRVPDDTLDRIYGAVARRRGRLGRLVPDGPAPRRYP
jgi:predicted DCC family thiol-disulfide oxidoreductase YuxK